MSHVRDGSPGYWPDIARRWALVGPPLRPSAADVATYVDVIARCDVRPLRALILGVTPELYRMQWPAGTELLAADHTPGMIAAVWPGRSDQVICAEWTNLPVEPASRNVVLCDGGLHLLAYPHGQAKLAAEMRRVIPPGGLCVLRLFVPPARRERADAVLEELLAGRVSNVNVLKLRLAMALQADAEHGVELRQVWDGLHRIAPDLDDLAQRIGWPLEPLRAIETYRDSPVRYCFVSVPEARRLLCDDGGFEMVRTDVPEYELGDRCPIVVLRRLPR